MKIYAKDGTEIECMDSQWELLKESFSLTPPVVKDDIEVIESPKKVVFKKKIVTEE